MKTRNKILIGLALIVGIAASGPVYSRLRDLQDVKFGPLQNGQILQYAGTAGRWTNAPAPAGTGDMTQAAYDADANGVVDMGAGGTGSNLADPGADRILFWDDSVGSNRWLTAGTGLTINDTTMTAAEGGETEGTVHATGTPEANELMMAADATGTNLVPSGIITDGSGGQTNTTVTTDELITPLIDGPNLTNIPNLHVTAAIRTAWNEVTLDDTNAVVDLAAGPNFYYSLSTSNYITFSNITAGAQGAILIYSDGAGQEVNFSGDYNNLSTNEIAPVFSVTNQAWIAYQVTFGSDDTNVTLGITRK